MKMTQQAGVAWVVAGLVAGLPGPVPPARGASLYYDVNPATAEIDGGAANWADSNWKISPGGTGGVAWADGDAACFEPIVGSPDTTTVTIGSGVTLNNGVGGVWFNGPGYTLTGGTLNIGSDWFHMVQPATINSALTRLQVLNDAELKIGGGGILAGRAIIGGEGANGRVRQTGGDLSVSAEYLMIGGNGVANARGEYILDAGSLTVGNGIYFGWKSATSYGTFTQNGGTVETQADVQGLQLGISGGHGTYNLNGGTLTSTFNAVGPGSADFNFGGGTFRARNACSTWAGMTATIADGKTAYIDTNGKALTWAGPITGASAAGLTKSGAGTLTLNGANSYSGATAVNAGTLTLSGAGAINGSSGIVVNGAGAKFQQASVTASTPAITLTQGTVDGAGTVGHLTVDDLAANTVAAGNGGTAVLTTGDLTFNGSGTLNLPNGSTLTVNTLAFNNTGGSVTVNASPATAWNLGNNKLIGYTSFDGANLGVLKAGTISGLGSRLSVTGFYNNTALKEIDLQIAGDISAWTGLVSGDWTVRAIGGLQNWKLAVAGAPTEYLNGEAVLFDDSVTVGTTSVTIADASVTPLLVTFNNSEKDYSLGGGPIAGGAALVKSGAGTLTVSNANTYTGSTTVDGGTLSLSGGDNRLPAGAALTLGGGTLALGANNQAVSGVTVNAGGGTVTGPGTLTNSGNPATAGNYVMNGNATITTPLLGNLYVSGNGTGTLTFSGGLATTPNRIVVGAGGHAVQSGGDVSVANFMMLGFNDGALGPTLSGSGAYTLESGSLTVANGLYLGWNGAGNSGVFTQNGGTARFNGQGLQLGIAGGHGTYNLNGGTLVSAFGTGGAPYTFQTFTFGGGTFRASANTASLSTMVTTIADGKTATVDPNGVVFQWNGPITGAGAAGLTVTGGAGGSFCLNATNTYAGVTTVQGGGLWLGNGTAAGSVEGNIVVEAGANVRFQRTGSYAVTNAISGAGEVRMGLGTAIVSGHNSHAGGTTVYGGALKIGSDTALSTGKVTVNGPNAIVGQLDLNGRTVTNAVAVGNGACGGVAASAPGCIVNSDTANPATLGGPLTLGGANYVGGAGAVTVTGAIGGGVNNGTYTVLKRGTGTWAFANPASSYDGFTYIAEGTLVVTKLANLNEPSSLGRATSAAANQLFFFGAYNTGGTLQYAGDTASTSDRAFVLGSAILNAIDATGADAAATLTLTGEARASAGAPTLTLTGGNAGANTYQGAIGNGSGVVSLAKGGSTTWVLAGSNTYTGMTTVNAGRLVLRSGALTARRTALVLGGGTLENAADAVNELGTLTVKGSSTLVVGSGSSLAFAASAATQGDWTGALDIVGTLVDGVTLRVGEDRAGLDATQLARIRNGGSTVDLTALGYLVSHRKGTVLIVR